MLIELCAHHGILVKLTEETYGFGHLALQEYVSAKWFASEQRWRELLVPSRLIDPWWENTIALCLAALSDATAAIESILNLDHVPNIQKLKLLSASLKYDPILSPDIREKILREILHLYHDGDSTQNQIALRMLVGIDDSWTASQIKRSLQSNLPKSRDIGIH